MIPTSQLELHPDADSLNAFVEQALADSERERVVAHLAGCSRCRQVVYLAQETAEAAAPAWVVATLPALQSSSWLRNWRLVWGPAAALAAALALVVVFHPKTTANSPEIAKVAPSGEIAPSPVLPEPPAMRTAHTQALVVPVKPAAPAEFAPKAATASAVRAQAPAAVPSAQLPAPPVAPGLSFAESNLALSPSGAPSGPPPPLGTMVQFKPSPGAAAWQQRQINGALSANAGSGTEERKSMRAAFDNARTSHTATVAAAMPRSAAPLPSAGTFQATTGGPMIQALDLRGSIKLPSGLAAVSTASALHRLLAIDASGALFLSEDAGKNWKLVPRQWTGLPIEIRARPGFSASTESAGTLELKNDGGLVWVSTDGMTWTMQ